MLRGAIPEIQFRSLRNLLAIATPEEIDAMVDANVVDVESAKLFLKQLLFALGQMWGSSGNTRQ